MQIYGRDFRLLDLAKTLQITGLSASPLLARAMARGPLTAFEFSSRACQLYYDVVGDDSIPQASLAEICGESDASGAIWLDLSQPSSEMPPGELALLCSLVKWKSPRVALEIGTFKGFTTLHLSRNTSDHARIFTVDLPRTVDDADAASFSDPQLIAASRSATRAFGNDPKITQLFRDSTTVDWKVQLGRPIDFALIDGSHLYEHVRLDTERVLDALSPSALVVWHDYSHVEVRRGVGRYLRELQRNGWPVKRISGTSLCVYSHHRAAQPH